MKIVSRIVTLIGFGLLALAVLGFFLPAQSVAVRSVDVSASPAVLTQLGAEPRTWGLWLPVLKEPGVENLDATQTGLTWLTPQGRDGNMTLAAYPTERRYDAAITGDGRPYRLELHIQRISGQDAMRVSLVRFEKQRGFPWISRVFEPIRRGRYQAEMNHALRDLKIVAEGREAGRR